MSDQLSTASHTVARPTNTAFVIFRPDLVASADSDQRIAAHFEALCDRYKIRRERTGYLSCPTIHKKGLFDAYFPQQEQNVSRVMPSHLRLSEGERKAFKSQYGGLEWHDLTSTGKVLNAHEYMRRIAERLQKRRAAAKEAAEERRRSGGDDAVAAHAVDGSVVAPVMGDISGENDDVFATKFLAELCVDAACGPKSNNGSARLVLNDSITIHRLPSPNVVDLGLGDGDKAAIETAEDAEAVFVVNGEFPLAKSIYADKANVDGKALWYTVSWRSDDLSWADFNQRVMGTVPVGTCNANADADAEEREKADPPIAEEVAEAEEQRLKMTLCKALAVDGKSHFLLSDATVKHLGTAGIVYSTGPLEAFFGLQSWLSVDAPRTLFGLYAMQRGISMGMLRNLVKNPPIHARGASGPAFVMTRGLDTDATLEILAKHAAEEAALPILNTALVFIKPHANNGKVRALVERMLADNELRIVVQGKRTAEAIRDDNTIVRHYSVIAQNALYTEGKTLDSTLSSEGRSKFNDTFGEDLSVACADGRVMSAKEALEGGLRDGETISAERLAMLWKLCDKVTKLGPGLYMGRCKDDTPAAAVTAGEEEGDAAAAAAPATPKDKYIINGFFPLIMDKFTADGASVQWYLVSWAEDKMTWADFRGKLIGPTDPSKAPTGSIRDAILSDWRALDLSERPNASDNGVHASAGPLEALAERLIWIGGSGGIEADVLTRVAAERGVATHYSLQSWIANPFVKGSGYMLPGGAKALGDGPIFDLTEDMQTSSFIEVLRQAEEDEAALRQRNHALVFIKPHAVTPAVKSVVETLLACHGITITRQGETDAETIGERNLVDRHYSVIAQNAMTTAEVLLKPRFITMTEVPRTKTIVNTDGTRSEVPLTAEDAAAAVATMQQQQRMLEAEAAGTTAMALMPPIAEGGQAAFEKAFGLSWADAVRCHSVLTAQEALELLDMSPMQLTKKWKSKEHCPQTVRVAPGMYVGHFVKEKLFIINGFYPLNREKFTTPGRRIRWFAVSWAEDRLTWADFRAKVIGPTDPTKAPEGSMRAVIYKEWEQLGLPACPDTSDNGVHASAGALEGLAERIIWLSSANPRVPSAVAAVIAKDPFGMLLLNEKASPLPSDAAAGEGGPVLAANDEVLARLQLPSSFIEYCLGNPTFADTGRPLFDVTEDTQSSACSETLRRLYYSAASEFKLNRAVLLLRPTTASPSVITAVERVLAEHSITVDKKETLLPNHYHDRVRLIEAPQIPAYEVILSREAKEKFHIQFGEEWDAAVEQGRVHTADAAAERLKKAYSAMSQEEQYKANEKTFDVAARWRQSGLDNNILYLSTGNALPAPSASNNNSSSSIAPTMEVGFDPAHDWYVMNGALCNTAFSSKDGVACCFFVSWRASETAYGAMLGQVVGAVDATTAPEDTIRGLVYRQWNKLGLGEAVAANDTGVKCSIGPLQALLQRCMWEALAAKAAADVGSPSDSPTSPTSQQACAASPLLSQPSHPTFRANLTQQLRTDPFGRELLNHGFSADVLQYILFCNPAVAIASSSSSSATTKPPKEGPILDLLAHHETSTVVTALLGIKAVVERMWEAEFAEVRAEAQRQAAAQSQSNEGSEPTTPSRAASRSVRAAQGAVALRKGRVGGNKNGPRNQALVFIKPHAADSDAVTQLVEGKLQESFIRIDAEGEIAAEVIEERRLIDAHYAAIATYALRVNAETIGTSTLTDATRAKFEATFGVSWAAATKEGKILNAAAALDTFGLTAKQLSERFADASVKLRLAPGLYVAAIPSLDNCIVINGFYPLNREKFTTPGRRIRWFAVSWAEDRLTWADFRAKVIGPTDPTKAPEGSMRAVIYKEWQALGLAACPNVSENGVHASAGPLEGVAERIIWTNATLRQLSFSRTLITQRGVTERFLERCLQNPSMAVDTAPIMAKSTDLSTELVKGKAESVVHPSASTSSTTSAGARASAASAAAPDTIKFGPIFDVLEDCQSSKALDIVQRMFETDRTNNMQNTALVFIKPHAITPMAVSYVEACFRENHLDILSQGAVTSEDIVSRGLIDKHYSTISKYALYWDNDVQRKAKADACLDEAALASLDGPNPLYATIQQEAGGASGYAAKLDGFKQTFGMGALEKVVRNGLLMSAQSAMDHIAAYEAHMNAAKNRAALKKYDDRHREITPAKDLYRRWDKSTTFIKLASGVYAKKICLLEESAEGGSSAAPSTSTAVATTDAVAKGDEDPDAVVQLPITEMHTFIVINGFYPKLKESYTSVVAGPALQWYLISWPERSMTWADFRAKFVGPTNPLQAPTGSLRGGLYTNWRDLGLSAKPDTTDNGVHASAGPLEGLVERLIWTTPAQTVTADGSVVQNDIILDNPDSISPLLHKDPLGCILMDHDLSADAIARMCANPTMTARGATCPVFVHTEDMQSSDLAPFLREAAKEEAEAQRKATEEAEKEAKRLAELMQLAATEASAQERSQPMNTAFVFIKPHAVTPAVKDLVESTFIAQGMTIKRQGTFTHNQVARVIDQHYNTVSAYATLKPPHHLVLSEEAKEAFKTLTDGKEEWEQAVAVGHVLNAADAMKELGEISPSMLTRRWEDAPKKVKLAPGVYVGYLPNDDMFVVNGFYPRIREKFTTAGSSLHYYVVEWPEEALTWRQFRADVVGPTDPSKAAEGSIRGAIFKNWRHLGLERQSNMADNGVHASAGPIEGLVERCVWLKQLPQLDPFGLEVVKKRGVPVEYFHKWTRNEPVAVSSSIAGLAFDLTEDMQSTAAANMIADAREYAETTVIPTRKVALMPKRTLYEASLRDFFINLNNMSTAADFERLFQYYDRDGRGTISREEFFVDYNRFECYGHPLDSARVEELFTKYDINKDGQMSFDEFCILMLERVAHM